MSELLKKVDALLVERENYGISGDSRLFDWRWRAAAELPKVAEELRAALLQNRELIEALKLIAGGGYGLSKHDSEVVVGALHNALNGKTEKKCPSTYSHSTHGKLICEKDADHLHRTGDVEHYSRNVKWMSV
jgi:hypothetical protein